MMTDERPQLAQPPDELSDDQLEQVTGGTDGGVNDPAQMFQQIMQQLTQGQGIQKDGSTDLDAGKK
jgi:bacteriocin-like protein